MERAGEGQRDLCVAVIQLADLWDVGIGEEDFASPAGKLLDCGMDPQMVCLCESPRVISRECAAHVRRVQEHKVPRRGVLQDLLEVAAGCTDVVGGEVCCRGAVYLCGEVEARVCLAPGGAVVHLSVPLIVFSEYKLQKDMCIRKTSIAARLVSGGRSLSFAFTASK